MLKKLMVYFEDLFLLKAWIDIVATLLIDTGPKFYSVTLKSRLYTEEIFHVQRAKVPF